MKRHSILRSVPLAVLFLALFGLPSCAPYRDIPPGTVKEIGSAIVAKEEVSVPTLPPEPAPSKDYQVGPGDVLLVDINGRPEFTVASPGANGKVQGSRVDGKGFLHVPLAGAVQVAGLTLTEIEAKLSVVLKKYLQSPWVVVEVAEYKSLPLYLMGQFKMPGTYYMDRPLNLVQGISLGSGFDPTANLRGARLSRDGKIVPVDLWDLLQGGDLKQNVWLKGGDTIYLPDNRNQVVFVFGAVKKPGVVPMPSTGMNLAQAVGSADLRDTGYDLKHLRIIRSLSTTRGQLIVVDFQKILKGEAISPPLVDGDVIYVPKSGFGNWNDAIADMLPSLQLVSNVLQPFVSIKYLSK
ncbi:polysaccharide biosynthesis/export family protein [Geomonas sp. Red32]|uniref:polysaccharide biosynthesis/export family protein n=1 Tax=Geomonas sp. Red32 TaxID=2912856 RepID=UPI002545CE06|nr:polysaccharide biosynthesis/export family protein [Geomonas sp. Red32]MCM0083607.1 polysaccharide biosynthesis/export family protein [Geomonas sp. Red32]